MIEQLNSTESKLTWLTLANGGGVLVRDSSSSPVPNPPQGQRVHGSNCLAPQLESSPWYRR
jgi:hypothetical protein